MSFTAFIEQPVLKEAFANWALPTKQIRTMIPAHIRETVIKAPSSGQYQSLVANAFSYMLQFHITRELFANKQHSVDIQDNGWVAERALELMDGHHKYGSWLDRWIKIISRSRALFERYMAGEQVELEKLAMCCQYLANADLFFRMGEFNPAFKEKEDVTEELMFLFSQQNISQSFVAQKTCVLNPWFADGKSIQGIDADLLLDNTIIDFKTTSEIQLSAASFRHLAGYAVLLENGGVESPRGEPICCECKEVGLYFSRHATLVKWHVRDMFQPKGFDEFSNVLMGEIKNYDREVQPRPLY